MGAKTSLTRSDKETHRTPPPCDGGAGLLLSASRSAAHYRTIAAQARALQAMTTTPRLKRYLGEMVARYEERAIDVEASAAD
jgi:hypothetical protein